MKIYLRILLFLVSLFIITYKIIVAMDTKEKDDSVFNQVKEIFSVSIPDKTENIGYQGESRMTISSYRMFDNSYSILL